ncbi:MAG: D-2-hydroxyacid dehydrogenase [Thermoflexales bacterium]
MNVLLLHPFSDASVARLRAGMPGANISRYASLADASPEALAEAEILFASDSRRLPLPGQTPRLAWLQGYWAGIDHVIGQPIFVGGRVRLTTSAGTHAVVMSEFAFMMMLNLSHRFSSLQHWRTAGTAAGWPENRHSYRTDVLDGATLGLIGYGAVGSRIAVLGSAFGMRILAMRGRQSATGVAAPGEPPVTWVQRDGLGSIAREADYLVIVAALTADTRKMISADILAVMKPGAYLVNIARGEIIDEPALIEALRARRIAGAALDVFETEPLPSSSPLWDLDNVILTPHVSGMAPNYESRVVDVFIDNFQYFVAGKRMPTEVDFERGY